MSAWPPYNPGCSGILQVETQETFDKLLDKCTFAGGGLLDGNIYIENILINDYKESFLNVTSSRSNAGTNLMIETINVTSSASLARIFFGEVYVSGNILLSDLSQLSNITLTDDSSSSVAQWTSVKLENLPSYKGSLTLNPLVPPGSVEVINTQLESITVDGQYESSDLAAMAALKFLNNPRLKTISIPNTDSVGALSVVNSSSEGVNFSAPSISQMENVTLDGVSVLSVVALTTLNGTGGFTIKDSTLASFSLPLLQFVTGDLTISNLTSSSLHMDLLNTIAGSLNCSGNLLLDKIDGLSGLTSVGKMVEMKGPISSINLPALRHVGEQFRIESTADLDCRSMNMTQLNMNCSSNLKAINTTSVPTSTPTVPTGPSSVTKAANLGRVGGLVGGIVGGILVLALCLLIWWRRYASTRKPASKRVSKGIFGGRLELEQPTEPCSQQHEGADTEIREMEASLARPFEIFGSSLYEMEGDMVGELEACHRSSQIGLAVCINDVAEPKA